MSPSRTHYDHQFLKHMHGIDTAYNECALKYPQLVVVSCYGLSHNMIVGMPTQFYGMQWIQCHIKTRHTSN